jgi:hypothetical protein
MPRFSWGRALLAALGFLAGGSLVYFECFHRAARGEFPSSAASLLGVLIVSTWVGPMRLRGRSTNEWLWTLVPVVVFLALEWRAESAIEAAKNGTVALMHEYGVRSSEFVGFGLAWLVASPNGKLSASQSGRRVFPWRLILAFTAFVTVVFETIQVRKYLGNPSVSSLEQFHSIQNLLIEVGCLIYVLALLRMVLRFWAAASARPGPGEVKAGTLVQPV